MRMRNATPRMPEVKRRRSSIQNGAHCVSSFTPLSGPTRSKKAEESGNYYRGALHA